MITGPKFFYKKDDLGSVILGRAENASGSIYFYRAIIWVLFTVDSKVHSMDFGRVSS